MKTMSPAEFLDAMKQAAAMYDTQHSHALADTFMCELLMRLGYHEGVEIFEQMEKWYE